MKTVRDLCCVAVAVVTFLLLLELSLRFAGIHYECSLYRLDADLGYVLRPGAAGWSVKERDNYERVSSQGLRDRFHTLQRPPGTLRIAVIGDSFSEAKQVEIEQAWWSIMERKLNGQLQPGLRRVEVINFGVAGYGLPQEYLVIKQKVWQYDPQIVLLTGTLHSLVLGSSRKYSSVQVSGGPIPYFVHSNEGLVLDEETQRQRREFVPPGRVADFVGDLSNASQVMSMLNALRRVVSLDLVRLRHGFSRSKDNANDNDATPAPRELGNEDKVLRGPADPEFTEAWRRSEDLIRLSRDEVTRHGAEFWFVLLDTYPQVDPDPTRREVLRRALKVDSLFVTDRAFGEFATRERINHLLPAEDLLAVAERRGSLHGFPNRPPNTGHWNELGHEAAGELLAQRLLESSPLLRESAGSKVAPVASVH